MKGQYRHSAGVVAGYMGSLLFILGFILLVPLFFVLVSKGEGESGRTLTAFLIPALIALLSGFLLRTTIGYLEPNITQAMLICAMGWIVLSALGALPFVIGIEASYIDAYFETMSGFTTTGFSTQNISSAFFGTLARQLFLVMMVIGGCAGSTAGGIKVQRVVILLKIVKQQIRKLIVPRSASNRIVIDGKFLDESEIHRVSAIFFIWMGLLFFGGAVTAVLSSLDGYTSFSEMFSAMRDTKTLTNFQE